jgi:hypothetical protein
MEVHLGGEETHIEVIEAHPGAVKIALEPRRLMLVPT